MTIIDINICLILGLVVVTGSPSDLSVLNRQLLELKLQLNYVLTQLSQSCKVEVIHKSDIASDTKKPMSPSSSTDPSKVNAQHLSPKLKPMDLQLSNSQQSSSNIQLSPVSGSKGGLDSPAKSPASGDEAKGANGDTICSAL